jgi:copper resistance protein D
MHFSSSARGWNLRAALLAVVLLLTFSSWSPIAIAQQNNMKDMPGMQDMPGMDMSQPETPAQLAKQAADKRESEFNHHLAGFLVIVAGIFLLAQDKLSPRWPGVRYVWPWCFLLAGIYLALFSDTEIWPVGHQTLWFAINHDPEDLQHKVFALILLFLGFVELQRARGKLKALWAAWAFPVFGMVGAIMLLFHHHSAGMHGAHHMETMAHIKAEHLGFAIVGGGVALTKGVSEIEGRWQGLFKKVWPSLMIVLGILLMLYTE